MVPFKGNCLVFARLSPVTTAGAVRSATLATAGLLVYLSNANLRDAPTQTEEIVMDCVISVLVAKGLSFWGTFSHFFQGGGTQKFTTGPMGFFSKPKLRHAQYKIGEIVTDICGVGASLMTRSYFWQDPQLLAGIKNENFTMAPNGTF